MYKNFVSFLLLAFSLHSIESRCGQHRSFSLLAPCQATCKHKKPTVCVAKPGCYCKNHKIWDSETNRCVLPNECPGGGVSFKHEGAGSGGMHWLHGIPGMHGIHGIGGGHHKGGSGSMFQGLEASIERLFGIPMKLPQTIVKVAIKSTWAMLTLNFSYFLKAPIRIYLNEFNFGGKLIQIITDQMMKILTKMHNIDMELVSKVITVTKGIFAWGIKTMVDLGVLQGKTTYEAVMSVKHYTDKIVSMMLKYQIWIISKMEQSVDFILKIMHVKEIMRITGLKQGIEIIRKMYGIMMKRFGGNLSSFTVFFHSIINQHREFWLPIFRRCSNTVTIVINALQDLIRGKSGSMGFHLPHGIEGIQIGGGLSFGDLIGKGKSMLGGKGASESGMGDEGWPTGESGGQGGIVLGGGGGSSFGDSSKTKFYVANNTDISY